MSLAYDDLLNFLQRGRPRNIPIEKAVLDVAPTIPIEPPLDVEEYVGDLDFSWEEDLKPWKALITNSVLLVMAATAVELYLELFAPPPEEGSNPAWRLVTGILENPSEPQVQTTERERNALLNGYREFQNPWEDNRYIRDALATLYDSASRFLSEFRFSRSGGPENIMRARDAANNTIYSAIRALALTSNDIRLPINLADLFQRPDGTWSGHEVVEFAASVYRYWIERWWNRVRRRLAFIDPYTLTLSGRPQTLN